MLNGTCLKRVSRCEPVRWRIGLEQEVGEANGSQNGRRVQEGRRHLRHLREGGIARLTHRLQRGGLSGEKFEHIDETGLEGCQTGPQSESCKR